MKQRSIFCAFATAGLIGLLYTALEAPTGQAGVSAKEDGEDAGENSRIKLGFELAPVPLNLTKKNRALVGLGSYIVNAQGGCNDCHTSPPFAPGGDPFAGEPEQINAGAYLGGGVEFGPFVSRNITPDAQGLPAGLTLDQFINTLRTGIDEDGDRLQVMPWPVYGKMTDRDLKAVYEYLSSIPSLPGNRDL